jgi:hypothetical protein
VSAISAKGFLFGNTLSGVVGLCILGQMKRNMPYQCLTEFVIDEAVAMTNLHVSLRMAIA